jgi:hypothetical protein
MAVKAWMFVHFSTHTYMDILHNSMHYGCVILQYTDQWLCYTWRVQPTLQGVYYISAGTSVYVLQKRN